MKEIIRKYLYNHNYKGSVIQKLWIKISAPLNKIKFNHKSNNVLHLGNEVLLMVNSISKETGISIWPEFGSVLGAYREHSFISFDPDIDLGILSENYSEKLLDKFLMHGCKVQRKLYLVKDNHPSDLLELSLNYKGLVFDIFLSYLDAFEVNKRRLYVSYSKLDEINNTYKLKYYSVEYHPESSTNVQINNIGMNFPGDVRSYLEAIYGNNFMTPIKGWIPPKDNPILTFLDPNTIFSIEN